MNIVNAVRLTIVCALIACVSACKPEKAAGYQGYLEADYAYIASSAAGRLIELNVERGALVAQGSKLYALDAQLELSQVSEAQARVAQATAQRDDLAQGRRPVEIEVITERVSEARAALKLAQSELLRARELSGRKLLSADALERATSTQVQASARLQSVIAEQKSAALAGRPNALLAAEALVAGAEAALEQANWRLRQTQLVAQQNARVDDVLFRLGEWVPAGAPVLKLLPEQGPFVRFFVPLQELSLWQIGANVSISCTACDPGITGTVSFIAPAPEYTPPVIFSESRSDDLMVRMEAKLSAKSTTPKTAQDALLAPGLPVTVFKK